MIEYSLYLIAGLIVLHHFFKVKVEHGFVYCKYPFAHNNSFGSLANPKEVKRGYMWTPVAKIKNLFSQNKKRTAYIDNFRVDEDYAHKSSMSTLFKKKAENTPIYFNPVDMRQGILLVGKMGAGKTEFYFNILRQNFYNRAVIHQVKAGDFTETFLRKRDMLFSPYDQRGYLWDVMSEDEGIVEVFFQNYSNAIMGDKKDFFSAAANRLYNELSIKTKTKYKAASPAVKWKLLIKAIRDLFDEMDGGTQKSKQDVKSTMEAILQPLEIMAWQMQNPNQKSFKIKDFFAKKNQTKLILDNLPEYEKALTPLFAAFTACLSQVHMSQPDSTTDFTLYALDEYFSMLKIMDDSSQVRLHTQIRGKAGILMPAVQYTPKDDKKLQQRLTSSTYAWVYFSVIEEETINLLKTTIGETEYVYTEESESRDSKNKKSKSYSIKHEKTHLINNHLLNGLGEKFEHLTYLPNHKALYVGYTPRAELPIIAKKTLPIDLTPFYEIKYSAENSPLEDTDFEFKDLFKPKEKLSRLDEFKLWKKFEAEKPKGETAVKEFRAKNNLVEVDLTLMFEKFIQNEQVLKNKMRMFKVDERFKLKIEYDSIKGDEAKELEFIEKNDLFGALPEFFEFKNEEAEEIRIVREDEWQ